MNGDWTNENKLATIQEPENKEKQNVPFFWSETLEALGKGVHEVGGITGQEPEVSKRRLTKYTSGVLGMSSSREKFCGRKLIASPQKRTGSHSLGREQRGSHADKATDRLPSSGEKGEGLEIDPCLTKRQDESQMRLSREEQVCSESQAGVRVVDMNYFICPESTPTLLPPSGKFSSSSLSPWSSLRSSWKLL